LQGAFSPVARGSADTPSPAVSEAASWAPQVGPADARQRAGEATQTLPVAASDRRPGHEDAPSADRVSSGWPICGTAGDEELAVAAGVSARMPPPRAVGVSSRGAFRTQGEELRAAAPDSQTAPLGPPFLAPRPRYAPRAAEPRPVPAVLPTRPTGGAAVRSGFLTLVVVTVTPTHRPSAVVAPAGVAPVTPRHPEATHCVTRGIALRRFPAGHTPPAP
jgi:hypothetical protein